MQQFTVVLTNYGRNLTSNSQVLPETLTYVLGSSFGYTPLAIDSTIRGSQILSNSTEPIVQSNPPRYTVKFDAQFLQSQGFGEIGLFDGSHLVALASAPALFDVTSGLVSIVFPLTDSPLVTLPLIADSAELRLVNTVDELGLAHTANPNLAFFRSKGLIAVADNALNIWELVGALNLGNAFVAEDSTQQTVKLNTTTFFSVGQTIYLSVTSGANKGLIKQGSVTEKSEYQITVVLLTAASRQFETQDAVKIYADAPSPGNVQALQQSQNLVGATIDASPIGQSLASTAKFSSLVAANAQITDSLQASSLNDTPIGLLGPASGHFTTLVATSNSLLQSGLNVIGDANFYARSYANDLLADKLTSPNVSLTGGQINATQIGVASKAYGGFSTVEASNLAVLNSAVVSGDLTVLGTTTLGNLSLSNLTANEGVLNNVTLGMLIPQTARFTTAEVLGNLRAFTLTVNDSITADGLTADSVVTSGLAATGGSLDNVTIGVGNPAPATVTDLTVLGTATLASLNAASINGTQLGNVTPSSARFTTLESSAATTLGGPMALLTIRSSQISAPNGLFVSSGVFSVDTENGKVGVNTATPEHELSVNGDIQLASVSGAYIRDSESNILFSSTQLTTETRVVAPFINGKIIFANNINAGTENGQFNGLGYFKASPEADYISTPTTAYHELTSSNAFAPTLVVHSKAAGLITDSLVLSTATPQSPVFSHLRTSSANVTTCRILGNGNLLNRNNSYGGLSDRSLKKNLIVYEKEVTGKLLKFQLYEYNLISDTSKTPQKLLGLIADEVKTVAPSLVQTVNDDGKEVDTVNYSVINLLLLKGFQEQQQKIAVLEQQVQKLLNNQ